MYDFEIVLRANAAKLGAPTEETRPVRKEVLFSADGKPLTDTRTAPFIFLSSILQLPEVPEDIDVLAFNEPARKVKSQTFVRDPRASHAYWLVLWLKKTEAEGLKLTVAKTLYRIGTAPSSSGMFTGDISNADPASIWCYDLEPALTEVLNKETTLDFSAGLDGGVVSTLLDLFGTEFPDWVNEPKNILCMAVALAPDRSVTAVSKFLSSKYGQELLSLWRKHNGAAHFAPVASLLISSAQAKGVSVAEYRDKYHISGYILDCLMDEDDYDTAYSLFCGLASHPDDPVVSNMNKIFHTLNKKYASIEDRTTAKVLKELFPMLLDSYPVFANAWEDPADMVDYFSKQYETYGRGIRQVLLLMRELLAITTELGVTYKEPCMDLADEVAKMKVNIRLRETSHRYNTAMERVKETGLLEKGDGSISLYAAPTMSCAIEELRQLGVCCGMAVSGKDQDGIEVWNGERGTTLFVCRGEDIVDAIKILVGGGNWTPLTELTGEELAYVSLVMAKCGYRQALG